MTQTLKIGLHNESQFLFPPIQIYETLPLASWSGWIQDLEGVVKHEMTYIMERSVMGGLSRD